MAVRKSRKRCGFFIYSDSALACVAGVERGRGRANLSARDRVGSADSAGCLYSNYYYILYSNNNNNLK